MAADDERRPSTQLFGNAADLFAAVLARDRGLDHRDPLEADDRLIVNRLDAAFAGSRGGGDRVGRVGVHDRTGQGGVVNTAMDRAFDRGSARNCRLAVEVNFDKLSLGETPEVASGPSDP